MSQGKCPAETAHLCAFQPGELTLKGIDQSELDNLGIAPTFRSYSTISHQMPSTMRQLRSQRYTV